MKNSLTMVAFLLLMSLKAKANPGYAVIVGKSGHFQNTDSVTLIIDKYGSPNFIGFGQTYGAKITRHQFHFRIPAENFPVIFHLYFSRKQDTTNYYRNDNIQYGLITKGDSISISADGNTLSYSGGGCEKMKVLQQFDLLFNKFQKGNISRNPSGAIRYFEAQDSVFVHCLGYLNKCKKQLNKHEFNLLKAFALSYYFNKGKHLSSLNDSVKAVTLDCLKSYQSGIPDTLVNNKKFDQLPILGYSDAYSSAIYEQYVYNNYRAQRKFDPDEYYRYVSQHYAGNLRQRLLVNLVYTHRKDTANISTLIPAARQLMTDPDFISIIEKISSSRSPGAGAFNFSLADEHGRIHRMSDYRGQVVFIDFWFTGCGNCAMLAPYLKKIEREFKGTPVSFLSINLDNNKTTWLKSLETMKYTSQYVTNLFTDGQAFRHPICQYYQVDGAPALLLIDRNGKLMNNPLDPRLDAGKNLEHGIANALEH